VLAGEACVIGEAEFGRAGSTESYAIARELISAGLAIGALDENLFGHNRQQMIIKEDATEVLT
jgi:hypothetical protein